MYNQCVLSLHIAFAMYGFIVIVVVGSCCICWFAFVVSFSDFAMAWMHCLLCAVFVVFIVF